MLAKNKTKQIEKFLEKNFETSQLAGVIAANSIVKYEGAGIFHIYTGELRYDILGSFNEVMQRLNEIVEQNELSKIIKNSINH